MNQVSRNVLHHQMSCLDEIHTYSLKPLSNTNYHKDVVCVNFQPSLNQKGIRKSTKPTFNADSQPFTPAFILPIQQDQYSASIHSSPDHLIQQATNQQNNYLLVAKPANLFCHVCKQSFSDYLKHIEHKIHRKNLKNSQYTNEIEDAVFQFQRNKTNKSQKRSFQNVNVTQCSIQKPNKIRILENTFTHTPNPIKLTKDASQSTNCHLTNSEFQSKLTF